MSEIDLVEILFTLFWIFFIGLVIYIQRESKREGYPLDSDRQYISVEGFPAAPDPKKFELLDGRTVSIPRDEPGGEIAAKPTGPFPGAPLEPTGNPMLDGIGPGAYSNRDDVPDHTLHGGDRIVPMRITDNFAVTENNADPRGYPVYGADGVTAGKVVDMWVDRCEPMISYFEVELQQPEGKRVLLPIGFSRIKSDRINVRSIMSTQFKDVPGTASPDRVTRLEEDKICAYYAGGTLYADKSRTEPLI
ncbi:MAG: photosynthetic reaction center subunit H [Pseudomonadota bacterium]